jgi:uncharacterized glyoxalase superfamily protein PhnB
MTMDLVNARIVTPNVAALAAFYSSLIGVDVVTNDYYIEIPTPTATVAFSCCRFLESDACAEPAGVTGDKVILDFRVDNIDDVDGHYRRLQRLGVDWVMSPTTQPWGNRSMLLRDPDANLINVFAPRRDQ